MLLRSLFCLHLPLRRRLHQLPAECLHRDPELHLLYPCDRLLGPPPHPLLLPGGLSPPPGAGGLWSGLCGLWSPAGLPGPRPAGASGGPSCKHTLLLVGALTRWQVRSIGFVLCGLPLHSGAVPNDRAEPGGGRLLPGGEDRGHHRPHDGPTQGLLAASTCIHHGCCCQCGQ